MSNLNPSEISDLIKSRIQNLQLAATAKGDLDCDGIQSTFTRFVFADPSTCTAKHLEGLYTAREAE